MGEGCSFVFENSSVDVGMMSLLPVISHSCDSPTLALHKSLLFLLHFFPRPPPSLGVLSPNLSLPPSVALAPEVTRRPRRCKSQCACLLWRCMQPSWDARVQVSVCASACHRARPRTFSAPTLLTRDDRLRQWPLPSTMITRVTRLRALKRPDASRDEIAASLEAEAKKRASIEARYDSSCDAPEARCMTEYRTVRWIARRPRH